MIRVFLARAGADVVRIAHLRFFGDFQVRICSRPTYLRTSQFLQLVLFPGSQVGRKQVFCALLGTFSFCVGIIHIHSVLHFYGTELLGEGPKSSIEVVFHKSPVYH